MGITNSERVGRENNAWPRGQLAELVRTAVVEDYVMLARSRGEGELSIVSGDVHKWLGLSSRHPAVCNALTDRTGELQCRAGVELIDISGPNPGATTRFTYRIL